MNTSKTVRLTVDLSLEEHKALKAFCAFLHVSMKDFVIALIHKEIFSKNVPNPETLKAMKEAEVGIGLKSYDSTDDMWESLGIDIKNA